MLAILQTGTQPTSGLRLQYLCVATLGHPRSGKSRSAHRKSQGCFPAAIQQTPVSMAHCQLDVSLDTCRSEPHHAHLVSLSPTTSSCRLESFFWPIQSIKNYVTLISPGSRTCKTCPSRLQSTKIATVRNVESRAFQS